MKTRLAAFCILLALMTGCRTSDSTNSTAKNESSNKRVGFYLHACWKYEYPFAVRSWKRSDYDAMFHLLKAMGFNTVMLWPVVEAAPMPLSETDAKEIKEFRPTIEDAQRAGLECWLTICPNVSCRPEIAEKPWRERSLYSFMHLVRMDDPNESQQWLEHRAKLLKILNNADGYVTIDGDPGGYAGAKPEDFLKIFLADRNSIDSFGTFPKKQKVIPWIWSGWGTKGVWQEPIEPFVDAELDVLKAHLSEPSEFLMGQCRNEGACRRKNVIAATERNLQPRSTLLCYESIEFEPSAPGAKLQFDAIRATFREENTFMTQCRGVFGNAQTPLMVLPNIFLFGQASRDPGFLQKSDEEVLREFAKFLGGPSEVLVLAWSCLALDLKKISDDLPAQLRAVKLKGKAAQFIPGGSKDYLEILARQVEARLQLLHVIEKHDLSNEDAAVALSRGAAALVNWWKMHRYVFDGVGTESFRWHFVDPTQVQTLQRWAAKNINAPDYVIPIAAARLAKENVLTETEARSRLNELVKR